MSNDTAFSGAGRHRTGSHWIHPRQREDQPLRDPRRPRASRGGKQLAGAGRPGGQEPLEHPRQPSSTITSPTIAIQTPAVSSDGLWSHGESNLLRGIIYHLLRGSSNLHAPIIHNSSHLGLYSNYLRWDSIDECINCLRLNINLFSLDQPIK